VLTAPPAFVTTAMSRKMMVKDHSFTVYPIGSAPVQCGNISAIIRQPVEVVYLRDHLCMELSRGLIIAEEPYSFKTGTSPRFWNTHAILGKSTHPHPSMMLSQERQRQGWSDIVPLSRDDVEWAVDVGFTTFTWGTTMPSILNPDPAEAWQAVLVGTSAEAEDHSRTHQLWFDGIQKYHTCWGITTTVTGVQRVSIPLASSSSGLASGPAVDLGHLEQPLTPFGAGLAQIQVIMDYLSILYPNLSETELYPRVVEQLNLIIEHRQR